MRTLELNNINYMFKMVEVGDAEYELLQSAVARKYEKTYEAAIKPKPTAFAFLDDKYRAEDTSGACFGLSKASEQQLFSEQYLSMPVETLIEKLTQQKISREKIVEVGSLVSSKSPGAGKKLVEMIPWLTWSLGYKYILITATSQLRDIFAKAGIPFTAITNADAKALSSSSKSQWGSYYDTDPITGLIDIEAAVYYVMKLHFSQKFNLDSQEIMAVPLHQQTIQTTIGEYTNA